LFERHYLMAQINRFGGNISRTASFVGMERSALHRKLKSLGVVTSNKAGARVAQVEEYGLAMRPSIDARAALCHGCHPRDTCRA
jgi:two-component system nitrogen regulation response regulator NtrX